MASLFGYSGKASNNYETKFQPIAASFVDQPIKITQQDRELAWALYQQMHTRVVTRELHARSGTEKAALNSVYQLFAFSREHINKIGPECANVAMLFNHVLNGRIERFTSKWHLRMEAGEFESSDVCRGFRLELFKLQQDLRKFKDALQQVALSKGDSIELPAKNSDDPATRSAETATATSTATSNSLQKEYEAETQRGWPTTTSEQRKRLLKAIEQPLELKFIPSKIRDFADVEKEELKQIRERREHLPPPLKANPIPPCENEQTDTEQQEDKSNGESKNESSSEDDNAKESKSSSKVQPVSDAVGLCFSGGGIRACTFAMGVTQRLAKQGVLKDVDYLSTVSGGGYFGTFLSSYMDTVNPQVGFENDQYPFGRSERTDTGNCNTSNQGQNDLIGRDESNVLRHIRNHASYLTGGAWYKFQMFGLVVFGLLVNLLMIFPFITFAVIVTQFAMTPAFEGIQTITPDDTKANIPCFPYFENAWYLFGALTLSFGGLLTLVRTVFRGQEKNTAGWRFNDTYGWCTLGVFAAFLFVTAVNLIPFLSYLKLELTGWINLLISTGGGESSFIKTLGSIVSAAAVPLLLRLASGTGDSSSRLTKVARVLFILSGPAFFLFSYLAMVEFFIVDVEPNAPYSQILFFFRTQTPDLYYFWFGLPMLLGIVLMNINFASPHLFYRDCLCNTFLLKAHEKFEDQTDKYDNVDIKKLSKLRSERPELPYHLVNAVINAPASSEPDLRGRGSDFYLFSQCYCGSPLTGYTETKEVEKLDAHINLGTAMAISGAAASPHSGALTDKNSVFLLTLLNVRLGYWVRNPKRGNWLPVLNRLRHPTSIYLLFEMFGLIWDKFPLIGNVVDPAYHHVSDGGHLENLGIYELLRRRCKFIVAVDGEADPDMHCASMMKLVRYARIDFGIEVHFAPKEFTNQENGFAKSHFALGVIDYGEANSDPNCNQRELGIIIYLKNNLTGNESPDILEYHQRNTDFPHVHIKDQFFDEEQFEAFRSLGYHVADEAMGSDIFDGFLPDTLSVNAWAEQLVRKLYEY